MIAFIVIALVAAGNASPLNDAQLQGDLPDHPHRNELENRRGKFARINKTYIFPMYTQYFVNILSRLRSFKTIFSLFFTRQ
jgi:hypothetical protein